jgi:hypothetical protein
MKRKINQVGTGTLTVSLPNDWVKRNKIQKGDELEVDEIDNNLVFGMDYNKKKKKKSFKLLKGNFWYIDQFLGSSYFNGYDEIEITFDNEDMIVNIQESVDKLLGYEIVTQKNNYCKIQAITEVVEEGYEIILKKVFQQTKVMFEKLKDDLINNKVEIESFKQMYNNNRKFTTYLRRLIVKKNIMNVNKTRALFFILTRNLMITSNMMYTYKYLDEKKLKIDKKVIDFLKQVKHAYELVEEFMFKEKLDNLKEINELRHDLINGKMVEYLEENKGSNCVIFHYLAEIMRIIKTKGSYVITYIDG